jgi:hypothetical protein
VPVTWKARFIMFWTKKNKAQRRFYLLPGQGGRLYWRKQKIILAWSLSAALVVAGIMAAIMYWADRIRH